MKENLSLTTSNLTTWINNPVDPHDEFIARFLQVERDLRAFIGSLLRDWHLRDDVFQEVALTLFKLRDEYDPSRPFGAWARGIAANKILQRKAQDHRFPVAFAPETIQAVVDAFDDERDVDSPRAGALRRCVDQLPPRSRELIDQRYEQGIKPAAIAERSGRSLDAVYQALSRVRQALEECIGRQLESGAAR